jgi:glycosyltransferase involved in cell wall biosynthesis
MPGRLTDGEIVALYRHALALVFPSLYEGFGIPPLEAMVHGCPVLAADIPAVHEVCGDAALYFNAHDVADCTHCLQEFLDDPAKAESLRQKGIARYSEFSWSKSAGQVLQRLTEIK